MPISKRKHNVYLDVESSDEGGSSGYNSGAVDSRTTQHRPKYPKFQTSASASASSEDDDVEDDDLHVSPPSESEPIKSRTKGKRQKLSPTSISSDKEDVSQPLKSQPLPPPPPPPTNPQSSTSEISPLPTHSDSPKPKSISSPQPEPPATKSKPLKQPSTSRSAHKTGVIYISRIPPYMKPPTLRRLLSPHGTILRIFLTPEAHSTYLKRRSLGGNKKRSFVDGWVEFSRRKDAKICAEAINAMTMGGRGWYGDDVWNVRYLKGFRWDDLMAGVRQEEREREERIRVGLGREARERTEFLKGVQRAKIEETRRGKEKKQNSNGGEESRNEDDEGQKKKKKKNGGFEMRFRQNEKQGHRNPAAAGVVEQQSEDVTRVLSKIF